MKTRDCRKFCREIDQADLEKLTQLSVAATSHLEICRDCREFHDDRLKLRQLVASLGTVEAPSDFESQLRARLSRQNVGAFEKHWIRGLSFGWSSIATAGLILAVGGGLLRYLRPDNLPASQVATQGPSSTANHDGSSPPLSRNETKVPAIYSERKKSTPVTTNSQHYEAYFASFSMTSKPAVVHPPAHVVG